MKLKRNTFKKEERLNNVILIDKLFSEGNSMFVYPFKVIYLLRPLGDSSPVQLLLMAPKRSYKHAVDRNRIKRLVREAYRINKHPLYESQALKHQQLLLGLVYVGKTILTYAEIEKKLIIILQRLSKKDEENIG
jgi:ribonuclease P protein component